MWHKNQIWCQPHKKLLRFHKKNGKWYQIEDYQTLTTMVVLILWFRIVKTSSIYVGRFDCVLTRAKMIDCKKTMSYNSTFFKIYMLCQIYWQQMKHFEYRKSNRIRNIKMLEILLIKTFLKYLTHKNGGSNYLERF